MCVWGGAKPTLLNLFPLTLCSQDFEMLRFYLPILSLMSRRPTMSHVVGWVLDGCKRWLKCNFPEIWPPRVKTASSEWRTACIAVLIAFLSCKVCKGTSLGDGALRVTGPWRGSPCAWTCVPMKEATRSCPFLLLCKDSMETAPTIQKAFTSYWICQHLDFGLPSLCNSEKCVSVIILLQPDYRLLW